MVDFDLFGPEKVLQVCDKKIGLNGFVVIDNTVLGPGKGGIRMTPTVSVDEVSRLARAMTWKNALAELPFGGAKSGICADSHSISQIQKAKLVGKFAKMLKSVCPSKYIAAPDIGTAEKEMAVFSKTIGSLNACTGKPAELGGLPHELGSTGFGVSIATKVAAKFAGMDLSNSTIAIEGFGNVGSFAAKYLAKSGAKIVAVSDIHGMVYNGNEGLDVEKLIELKDSKKSVIECGNGIIMPKHDIVSMPVDILIPAAIPDLIIGCDVRSVKAKIIIEGSNIPISPEFEKELLIKRGTIIVPDIIANAGGVISSYIEYIGGSEKKMFEMVEEKISKNTELILKNSQRNATTPRETALEIAKQRILEKSHQASTETIKATALACSEKIASFNKSN